LTKEQAYYIEFQQIGRFVKVTAIDPVSRLEVSIVGDPSATQDYLSNLAVKKLIYVLEKKKRNADQARKDGLLI
jgi:hypothetical protein